MLDFIDILGTYPVALQGNKEHIYKEYLQYHILEGIAQGPGADKLCFIGGTALRLCYDNHRFSEDLDFDNKDLSYEDFDVLMQYVADFLVLKGFEVETKIVRKGAYHYSIKFPRLLYEAGLSHMATSKILIQIDTHDQGIMYPYMYKKLMKFETVSMMQVAPLGVLLSMKLYTVFERKRMKGRDFFDIMFLCNLINKPDWNYLDQTIGITDPHTLKTRLLEKCAGLDFAALQADVQPFLFQPQNQSVKNFVQFVEMMEFEG